MPNIFESPTITLPQEWITTTLKELLDVCRNGLISSQDGDPTNSVPVTRIETISRGKIDWNRVGYVPVEEVRSDYFVQKGDILLSHINSVKHIGKVARKQDSRLLLHGLNLMLLRFNKKIDSSYAYALMNSVHTKRYFERRSKKAVNQASINKQDIFDLKVKLPALIDQKIIATIFDGIEDTIERTEELISKIQQLRDTLLNELLTRGLPGHHTEWKVVPGIGNIPVNWQVVPLGQYALVRTGGTPSRSRTEYWYGKIPWMVSGDINQLRVTSVTNYITDEGLNNSNAKIFPAGTVMVAMNGQGTTRGKVAQLAIDTSCNQSLAAIQTNNDLHNNYLFYLLRFYYNRLRRLTGDGRKGLNLKIIRNILIPLPSLLEQEQIADVLYTVDIYLQNIRNILETINTIRVSTSENIFSQIVSRKEIS